jgi:hypothetical protein
LELLNHLRTELCLSDVLHRSACLSVLFGRLRREWHSGEAEVDINDTTDTQLSYAAVQRDVEEMSRHINMLRGSSVTINSNDVSVDDFSDGAHKDLACRHAKSILIDISAFCRSQLEEYHDFVDEGLENLFTVGVLLIEQCEELSQQLSTAQIGIDGGGARLDLSVAPDVADAGVIPLPAASADQIVAEILTAGVQRLYDGQTELFPSHKSAKDLSIIAKHVRDQVYAESKFSAPFFVNLHRQPLSVILLALVDCVKKDYANCSCTLLGDDVIQCIATLRDLDCTLIEHGVAPTSTVLSQGNCGATDDLFYGLAQAWIDDQRSKFDEHLKRGIVMEEESGWAPVLGSVRHSASVLDLFAMFSQTVDQFFEMNVPWENFFLSLVENIVETAINYANLILVSCRGIGPGPPRSRLCKPRRQVHTTKTAAQLTPPDMSVIVRLNNIHHGSKQFGALWSRLKYNWKGLSDTADGSSSAQHKLDHMLRGMERSYSTTASNLVHAVGNMTVYTCMQGTIVQNLYVPTAQDSRCDDNFFRQVEELLRAFEQAVEEGLLTSVVAELKRAVLEAFEWAVLDAGPRRIFTAADVPILKEDYMSILAFFADSRLVNFGKVSFDKCSCSRCSEAWATVFCADCEQCLFCDACSSEIHQGKWSSHCFSNFTDHRNQCHAHNIMRLLEASSSDLITQLQDLQQQTAAYATTTDCDMLGIVRVLSHRVDDHAVSCLRQIIADYDGQGDYVDNCSNRPSISETERRGRWPWERLLQQK